MDSYRVIELLEYIKTFDEHNSGATKIALDKAIESVIKIQKIEEAIEHAKQIASGSYVDVIAYADIKNILGGKYDRTY